MPSMPPINLSRRRLLGGSLAAGAAWTVPAWARGADIAHNGPIRAGFDEVRGPRIDLTVGEGMRIVAGRRGHTVAVNGSVPGPLLRLKEGTTVRLAVRNTLHEDTSIHWHGLLLPFHLDGVPGVSFPGIAPGQTFVAEFPVRQSGTYWWHSHSNLQEQAGHYGPIVSDPAGADPVPADRDYILVLSEFTPRHPHDIMRKLKTGEEYFNRRQTSLTDSYPLSGAERRMWARMRMSPTDILDVTAPEYTYLVNGFAPDQAPEFAFRPGERVRLRVINAGAMTFFNVRIPGLRMTVFAADGQNVRPVVVDEFQIGAAETYDLVVEPTDEAHAIIAEDIGRTGTAVAHLASRPGARAAMPPPRPSPLLTMRDMGMDHGGTNGDGMDHSAMGHGTADHGAMGHAGPAPAAAPASTGHGMAGMSMRDTALLPPQVAAGAGVDMVAMNPVDRMGDPGIGLDNVPGKALTYRDLVALVPNTDRRAPGRTVEIHLTGNMERYMWSFDGRRFSAVSDNPIRFAYNERVRVKLVNNTMMAHPIHLHGHFFELANGAPAGHQPRKHTLIVQPGGSATFDLTADEPGDWAFHCHLLYHMHAGMFQVVTVAQPETGA